MVNLMLADSIRIDYKSDKGKTEEEDEVCDLSTAEGRAKLERFLGA